MPKLRSAPASSKSAPKPRAEKVVRKVLADGTIREYRYSRSRLPKARKPTDTLAALLDAYRASPDWRALAAQTVAMYRVYHRELEPIGDTRVAELRRRDLLDLRDAIAEARGNGAGTGFMRTTSALLAWALDRGWIEYHPLARVKALPGGHLPAWSETQAAHALAVLPEPYRRVVVLGMHTGQRRGDMIRLTWAAYDGATITLRQRKTARHTAARPPMVIPAHPDLRRELDAWKAERHSTHILTAPRGQPWTDAHLSREMGKLLAAAGLPGLNVHGLRKLAATRLAEAGCSAHEIAAITGHQSLSMVQLYTAAADQRRLAGAAVERLETRKNRDRNG